MTIFSRFMKDKSGVTAIEYGLIAAIVGVGIIAVLKNVRTGLQSTFNQVNANSATAGISELSERSSGVAIINRGTDAQEHVWRAIAGVFPSGRPVRDS